MSKSCQRVQCPDRSRRFRDACVIARRIVQGPIDIRLSCTVPGRSPTRASNCAFRCWSIRPIRGTSFRVAGRGQGPHGQFFGYVRRLLSSTGDQFARVSTTGQATLPGHAFSAATIIPSYLRNLTLNVHIWSSFEANAVDFGVAGPALPPSRSSLRRSVRASSSSIRRPTTAGSMSRAWVRCRHPEATDRSESSQVWVHMASPWRHRAARSEQVSPSWS